jgi:hypothetical protein
MIVIEKNSGQRFDVSPYYLHGRLVAYVGDLVLTCEDGNEINFGKHSWLPDEIKIIN